MKGAGGAARDGVIAESVSLYSADRAEKRIPRASVEERRQSRLSIILQGLDAPE